jgi:hypothetical protein
LGRRDQRQVLIPRVAARIAIHIDLVDHIEAVSRHMGEVRLTNCVIAGDIDRGRTAVNVKLVDYHLRVHSDRRFDETAR